MAIRDWRRACVGIGYLALVMIADGQDRVAVGLVAEKVGTWTRVRDGRVLEVGDEVFPDTTVQTKPSTTSRIKISFFDERPVWQRNCAQMPCNGGSFSLPESKEPPRGFAAFIRNYPAARSRVPRIFTAARSLGTVGPHEAVLLVDSGTVALTPALAGIQPARVRVTLSNPSLTRDSGSSAVLNWPKEDRLSLKGVTPGIFALDVQNERGDPIGSPAAVLVAGREFPSASDEFSKARGVAARWEGVDQGVVRGFLVQALYAILPDLK